MKAARGERLGSKLKPKLSSGIQSGGVYSLRDAKRLLRMDSHYIVAEVEAGRLKGRRERNRWIFLGQSLIDWVLGDKKP